MMQKVIVAKIGNTLTGYGDKWDITLACGHKTTRPIRPADKMAKGGPKAPKRADCWECDKAQEGAK